MNKNNMVLWFLALCLIGYGIIQPGYSSFSKESIPAPVAEIQTKCEKIISIIKSTDDPNKKKDMGHLVSLYSDLSKLISMDSEDTVIKNTEEIKEANRLSGKMLDIDLKDKYENLGSEMNIFVISSIGDDNVVLSPELRQKSVETFKALAWAVQEGSK